MLRQPLTITDFWTIWFFFTTTATIAHGHHHQRPTVLQQEKRIVDSNWLQVDIYVNSYSVSLWRLFFYSTRHNMNWLSSLKDFKTHLIIVQDEMNDCRSCLTTWLEVFKAIILSNRSNRRVFSLETTFTTLSNGVDFWAFTSVFYSKRTIWSFVKTKRVSSSVCWR